MFGKRTAGDAPAPQTAEPRPAAPVMTPKPAPVAAAQTPAPAPKPKAPTPPPKEAPSFEEHVEHTLNTESQDMPVPAAPGAQFDDEPTPVKKPPALRDLGIDSQSDFAEDTSKGGLPRGLSPNASHVDAGQYLTDDDLETID